MSMIDDWLSFISIPTVQLHTPATMVQSSKRTVMVKFGGILFYSNQPITPATPARCNLLLCN